MQRDEDVPAELKEEAAREVFGVGAAARSSKP
jgi:hypothetical protein